MYSGEPNAGAHAHGDSSAADPYPPCVVPPTPPLDSYTEGSQGTPRSSLVVRGVRPRSVPPTNYSIIILVGGGPRKTHENLAQATQIGKTDSAAQDSGLREDSAKLANCWPGHTEWPWSPEAKDLRTPRGLRDVRKLLAWPHRIALVARGHGHQDSARTPRRVWVSVCVSR